jgi:hypothetical protein
MKILKKILVVLTFILIIGTLTACSSINKVSRNFEKAGYSMYEYNFRGGSILFSNVDAIVNDLDITIEITTITTEEGSEPTTTATTMTVITTNPLASVLGFRAFAFSNGKDKVAIVLEFKNADYLQEIIEKSPALQALLEGLDPEDYINGNCLLIADQAYYAEVADIFTGRNIPVITTALTTTPATTEPITTTE